MQAVTAETWRTEGPCAPQHVGDLAWMRFQHRGRECEWRVRLCQRNGTDVAWAWLWLPDSKLFWCIWPEERAALAGEMLEWAERESPGSGPTIEVQSADAATLEILAQRGYALDDRARVLAVLHRELADDPLLDPPHSFRLRTVEPEDLSARVALHRRVWAPSRVTAESFRDVQNAWPYRSDLDCVAETADGQFAAYCLAWLDLANRAGELEPVGTHPDFRRLGLASTVCRFALHRLREAGATRAVVYAAVDAANPGPKALYESIGFVETSRLVRYVRDR